MGLARIERNWYPLSEDDRILHGFQEHLQSGDLATTSFHNTYSNTVGTFQLGGTTSMSTKSLSCEKIKQGRYPSGLDIFEWKRFSGKAAHTLII